jgi:hypothetical protein
VAASDTEVRKGQARVASQLILGEGNQDGGISGTKEGRIVLEPREIMAKPILPIARRAPANFSMGFTAASVSFAGLYFGGHDTFDGNISLNDEIDACLRVSEKLHSLMSV